LAHDLALVVAPLPVCGGSSLLTAPALPAISAPRTNADRSIGLIVDAEFAEHFSLVSDGHSLRAPPP